MPTIEELVQRLEKSRAHFAKHVKGMTDEQCAWKPYPECMSVLETLAHLRVDDIAAMESLDTGEEPKYEAISAPITEASAGLDRRALEDHLRQSHSDLVSYLRTKYANATPGTEVCVWGTMMPIELGIPHFSSEDFYHAGQVAFIRQAQDPSWNYYAGVYGSD